MKEVYFIRHAKSSWEHPGLNDIERPLNKRGKRDAPFMAELMAKKGIQPDLLISSPAKRALTTAKHFAAALEIAEADIVVKREIYEAYTEEIMDFVKELPESAQIVFIFGHNPTWNALANRFSRSPIQNVPTTGIFQVVSPHKAWPQFGESGTELKAFYYPKQFFS